MSLPHGTLWRAVLPDGGRSTRELPAGTRGRLPASALHHPPPIIPFTAEGILTAVAAPAATALFTAEGLLSALGVPVATAGFSGEGNLTAPQNEADALFEAVGALTASAIPAATALFSTTGLFATAGAAQATAAFSATGSLSASGYPTATADFSGGGALSAAATVFTPTGMTKNGTQPWGGQSYVPVTGWVANTGAYPGSSVVSDKLVVEGSKTGATISAQVAFSGGSFSLGHTIRLVDQNNTVIGSPGATVTGQSGTCTVTAADVDLAAITHVGVQMLLTFSSGGGTVTAGANTFLTIT